MGAAVSLDANHRVGKSRALAIIASGDLGSQARGRLVAHFDKLAETARDGKVSGADVKDAAIEVLSSV